MKSQIESQAWILWDIWSTMSHSAGQNRGWASPGRLQPGNHVEREWAAERGEPLPAHTWRLQRGLTRARLAHSSGVCRVPTVCQRASRSKRDRRNLCLFHRAYGLVPKHRELKVVESGENGARRGDLL